LPCSSHPYLPPAARGCGGPFQRQFGINNSVFGFRFRLACQAQKIRGGRARELVPRCSPARTCPAEFSRGNCLYCLLQLVPRSSPRGPVPRSSPAGVDPSLFSSGNSSRGGLPREQGKLNEKTSPSRSIPVGQRARRAQRRKEKTCTMQWHLYHAVAPVPRSGTCTTQWHWWIGNTLPRSITAILRCNSSLLLFF
jgi:hypothetical protein